MKKWFVFICVYFLHLVPSFGNNSKSEGTEQRNQNCLRLLKAVAMATEAHRGQLRLSGNKGSPARSYIEHPIEVATLLVQTVPKISTDALTVALLHDTLEDTNLNPKLIEEAFGPRVLQYIRYLTVPEGLDSADKLKYQIQVMAKLPKEIRWVKVVDRISNVMDIKKDRPRHWSSQKAATYIEDGAQIVVAAGPLPQGLENLAQEVFGEALQHMRDRRWESLFYP